MTSENYVAKLYLYAQTARLIVTYEEVGVVGPDHIKTFTLKAVVNGQAYPEGVGKNKKEAKQNAAKNALEHLLDEPADAAIHVAEASPTRVQLKASNYTCWLNLYSQRNPSVTVRPEETTTIGSVFATHWCKFVVGDKEYPVASGKTKKEAKEEAAKLVYKEITGSETLDTGDDKDSGTSSLQSEDLEKDVSNIIQSKHLNTPTDDRSVAETNFIGMIHMYCQEKRCSCRFTEEKRCGPSHCPIFSYKLVINDKEYPVGEGRNIKEAKQNAAKLAWSELNQSDLNSKVVSDKGEAAKDSSPTSLKDRGQIKSTILTPNTSDSIVFMDSSPNVQVKSPDVKPKIKIAANFQNVCDKSKEDGVNFKLKDKGNTQRAKAPTQSAPSFSRFTLDYDSIESLDKGSFGRVFKAKHKLENKFYAVKIVRYKDKTLQEVKVLSALNHCNIVRYHSCWIEDTAHQWDGSSDASSASQSSIDSPMQYLYIQMELCDIKTLRVWIDQKNIQNPKKSLRDSKRKEEGLSVALEIISGVEYIHSMKLIHRDLKPANIMFDRTGTVKIGDFGLVTPVIEDDSENQRERRGYKGTPPYMAPEQRSGKLYDRKVDIFAVGLIYFELFWNIPTIHEKNDMWDDVRNQKLPQGFCQHFNQESQIIKSMLCFKPEERPEACKIKMDLEEEHKRSETLKTLRREIRTV